MVEKGSSQSIVKKKGRPSKTPKQSSEFKHFLFLWCIYSAPLTEWLHGCSCGIQEVKFENKRIINSSKVGLKVIVFHSEAL